MKFYKGYYIDHIYFNSESEIDEFIKNQTVDAYKRVCAMFSRHSSMELVVAMEEYEEKLVKVFGMTCVEVEDIQIAVFAAV